MKIVRRISIIASTLLMAFCLVCICRSVGAQQATGKAELVVQTGHTGSIRSVAFSHDGRFIASSGEDNTIKIWDVEAERELRTLAGHTKSVTNVVFTADNLTLVSASYDGTVKLWEVASGKQIRTTESTDPYDAIESLALSPDGNLLAASKLGAVNVTVYDAHTLNPITRLDPFQMWGRLAFSPDSRILATCEQQWQVRLWDPRTGVELRRLTGPIYDQFSFNASDITFSPDGKTVATAGQDKLVRLWDATSGAELKVFRGHTNRVSAVNFTPDGTRLISSGWDRTVRFWDINSGGEIESLRKTGVWLADSTLSDDGKVFAAAGKDEISVWALDGSFSRSLRGNVFDSVKTLLSPNGHTLAVASEGKVSLWSLASSTTSKVLDGHKNDLHSWAFSPDGRILATGGGFSNGVVKLWDVETGVKLRELRGHVRSINALAFSPDGKLLATGGDDGDARIWNIATGELTLVVKDETRFTIPNSIDGLSFTSDGKHIVRTARVGLVVLNAATGTVEQRPIAGPGVDLLHIALSPDNNLVAGRKMYEEKLAVFDLRTGERVQFLDNTYANREIVRKIAPAINLEDETVSANFAISVAENHKIKIYDRSSHAEIATLVGFNDGGWAVVTPDGLFDASTEARKRLHYVVGLEAVTLDQMKDVYYVPGLLHKIIAGEPLPKIELFSSKDLYPDVEFSAPLPGDVILPIRITDRGGGIGQVQVLINGKEFVRDARPANFDAASKRLDLKISLKDAPFVAAGDNRIEVIARNAAGSLTNRGSAQASEKFATGRPAAKPDPNIYIIAGGISRYGAENLNLNFASKDADDFSKALEIGAAKLLKDKSKVHVRLLTSSPTNRQFVVPDAKNYGATKADFEHAFADFKGATANDVFVVYLAGHGVTVGDGGPAGNTYLYLTQEATTADRSILAIENSRRAMAVSSEELKEMMKQNKALKQALILDTCAAGAASGSFVTKRDVPPDQIAALERLKDNTGFYILMGSAADAVSYEASQYGQGLLTYSLLQGMKGARLRDDQFADVEMLFGYAKDAVGRLAKNVGGMQQPRTITPDVSRSFDIGQFTSTEREQINTLANPVPLILRPRLTNPKVRYDNLGLEKLLQTALRRASLVTSGFAPKLMFVESDEMQDAYLPSGDYAVEGDTITINLVLVRNDRPGREITVSGKLDEKESLIDKLVERIIASGV